MNIKIFLSDEAFNSLTDKATRTGYIRIKNRALGLGRYIDALSNLTFIDNRPDYLRDWHPQSFNIWFIPEYAGSSRMRSLNVSPPTIYRLVKLALSFDILRITIVSHKDTEKVHFMFRKDQTPTMIMSATLEAIGTDLLIPTSLTQLSPPKYVQRPRLIHKEFSW